MQTATVLFPDRAPNGRDLSSFQAGLLQSLQTAFDVVASEPAGAFVDLDTGASYPDDATRFHVVADGWNDKARDRLDRIAGMWADKAGIACAFVTHADGSANWVRTSAGLEPAAAPAEPTRHPHNWRRQRGGVRVVAAA